MALPSYSMSVEVCGYVNQVARAVCPFADSLWLPWAAKILPELAVESAKADARQKREDKKLTQYTAGEITMAEYMAKSDNEDDMNVDETSVATILGLASTPRDVKIIEMLLGSTTVNAKVKEGAMGSVKIKGKGNDKAKGKGKGKGKEKAADKPNREPSNLLKNATLVRLSLISVYCVMLIIHRSSIWGAIDALTISLSPLIVIPLQACQSVLSVGPIKRSVHYLQPSCHLLPLSW